MSKVSNEIAVTSRDEFGNNASRRARKNGLIPAVVCTKGKESRALYLKANEWDVFSKQDHSLVYLVDGDSKTAAVVKEVQRNYMKNYVVHIDFNEVDENAEISTELAIHPHGMAAGVNAGGVLEQHLHALHVKGVPASLPEHITVDVASLNIGDSVLVKDIVLPNGVKALNDAEEIVFHVMHQVAEEVVEAPAVEAEEAPAAAEEAK